MSRFLINVYGVLAIGHAVYYFASPRTGLYDYEAGGFRTEVVAGLLGCLAVGAATGLVIRFRRRARGPVSL